jgi:hypothetical protein
MNLDELRRAGFTPAAEVAGYPHEVVGFGDLDEALPPTASQLLGDLLPAYAESRGKWPLWTYECRSHRRSSGNLDPPFHDVEGRERRPVTWHGTRSWADRLAFSPVRLLSAFEETLNSKGTSFGLTLMGWLPGNSLAYFEPAEDTESNISEFFYRLTYLEQLTAAALCAQTARSIPGAVGEIEYVGLDETSGLSPEDFDELRRTLAWEFVRPRRWENEESQRMSSFLTRIIRLQWEASRAGKKGGLDGSSVADKDTRTLASEFFRQVGLIPGRRGGPRTAIAAPMLVQLQGEAEDIAGELKKGDLDAQELGPVLGVIKADPQKELSPHDEERLKRGRMPPQLITTALQLQLPFLLRAEISRLRERFNRGATVKEAARYLSMSRLPGYDPDTDDAVFEISLSKARRAAS